MNHRVWRLPKTYGLHTHWRTDLDGVDLFGGFARRGIDAEDGQPVAVLQGDQHEPSRRRQCKAAWRPAAGTPNRRRKNFSGRFVERVDADGVLPSDRCIEVMSVRRDLQIRRLTCARVAWQRIHSFKQTKHAIDRGIAEAAYG